MGLSEIIKNAITEAGGDGLCNVRLDCGCGVDDLAPCCAPDLGECEIAIQYEEGDFTPMHKEEYEDERFVPLRKEGEE